MKTHNHIKITETSREFVIRAGTIPSWRGFAIRAGIILPELKTQATQVYVNGTLQNNTITMNNYTSYPSWRGFAIRAGIILPGFKTLQQ